MRAYDFLGRERFCDAQAMRVCGAQAKIICDKQANWVCDKQDMWVWDTQAKGVCDKQAKWVCDTRAKWVCDTHACHVSLWCTSQGSLKHTSHASLGHTSHVGLRHTSQGSLWCTVRLLLDAWRPRPSILFSLCRLNYEVHNGDDSRNLPRTSLWRTRLYTDHRHGHTSREDIHIHIAIPRALIHVRAYA